MIPESAELVVVPANIPPQRVLLECPLLHEVLSLSHTTLLITCTCCYDQIKGTQDKDFSYSFSDSLCVPSDCMPSLCAFSLFVLSLYSIRLILLQDTTILVYTHTHTLIITVVMMRSTEFKTSRFVLSTIHSSVLSVSTFHSSLTHTASEHPILGQPALSLGWTVPVGATFTPQCALTHS